MNLFYKIWLWFGSIIVLSVFICVGIADPNLGLFFFTFWTYFKHVSSL